MKNLTLLSLLALACVAPAQVVWQNDDYLGEIAARPELSGGLMVATPLGPPMGHPFPNDPYWAIQRVRVEDSPAFAPGTTVDVYLPTLSMRSGTIPKAGAALDPRGGMPVGERVLLVARLPKDGVLKQPLISDGSVEDSRSVSAVGPAALGEAFFLTARKDIPLVVDPKWRLIQSIAEAIPNTGDDNAKRIADLLPSLLVPRVAAVFGRPDDRFSKLFSNAVAGDTPYHRALVDLALNDLRYWGYEDRFSRDLRAAADDPGAFPDGVPTSFAFEEDPGTGNNPELPKEFRHDPPLTQAEILAVLRRAKSPTIAAGFLHGLTAKPADADLRSMARFLDSPDPRLRHAFVERLAAWGGFSPPAEPTQAQGEDGRTRTEYPGLDADVARWKIRLAGKAP